MSVPDIRFRVQTDNLTSQLWAIDSDGNQRKIGQPGLNRAQFCLFLNNGGYGDLASLILELAATPRAESTPVPIAGLTTDQVAWLARFIKTCDKWRADGFDPVWIRPERNAIVGELIDERIAAKSRAAEAAAKLAEPESPASIIERIDALKASILAGNKVTVPDYYPGMTRPQTRLIGKELRQYATTINAGGLVHDTGYERDETVAPAPIKQCRRLTAWNYSPRTGSSEPSPRIIGTCVTANEILNIFAPGRNMQTDDATDVFCVTREDVQACIEWSANGKPMVDRFQSTSADDLARSSTQIAWDQVRSTYPTTANGETAEPEHEPWKTLVDRLAGVIPLVLCYTCPLQFPGWSAEATAKMIDEVRAKVGPDLAERIIGFVPEPPEVTDYFDHRRKPVEADDLAAKVADAAKWLDEKRPGWIQKIQLDPIKPHVTAPGHLISYRVNIPTFEIPEKHRDAFSLRDPGPDNDPRWTPLWLAEIDRRLSPAVPLVADAATASEEAAR